MCVVSIDFFKDWRAMIIMRPKIKSIDWYCIGYHDYKCNRRKNMV